MTEGLPIEYRADIQFELIHAGKVVNARQREALVVDLFHSADSATYKHQQSDVVGGSFARHREIARALLVLEVSALSIKVRSVRMLLGSNPSRARNLFASIRLDVPSCSCSSPVLYDVSDYYRLATEIINTGFSKAEIGQRKPAALLMDLLRSLASPLELAPAAQMLTNVDLAPDEFAEALSAYVRALGQVSATDREIQGLEGKGRLTFAIEALADHVPKGQSARDQLVAYRGFLTRSLTGSPCADKSLDRQQALERFNKLVVKFGVQDNVSRLDYNDLRPLARMGDRAVIQTLPEGSESREPGRRLDSIRRSSTKLGVWQNETDAKEAGDLADQMLDVLRQRAANPGECDACLFDYKSAMYLFLIDSAMPKHGLERAISDFTTLLAYSPVQKESPPEWMFALMRILNQSRCATPEQKKMLGDLEASGMVLTGLPSAAAAQIRDALRRSGDLIIAAYLAKEEFLGAPYMSPYERFAGKRMD